MNGRFRLTLDRFAQPAQSWQDVLRLIQECSLGQEILHRVTSLCKAGKLSFRAYPLDLRAELLSAQAPGCPLGAAFITDGIRGEIFYDAGAELGILVPFLFHEMIHSLDEKLWLAAGKSLSTRDKNDLVYSSEWMAFSAQHEFQEGLKKIYPELRRFHKERYVHLEFLNRALFPDEIRKLYGLVIK